MEQLITFTYYCKYFSTSARASLSHIQWSLYFKTTHGTKNIWYYIAGGLKIKVI